MTTLIFDLDGVIIDSEHMMNQAWNICELEHKLEQPFSEYFKHIGKPLRICLTGKGSSIDLISILDVLGVEEIINRIKYNLEKN